METRSTNLAAAALLTAFASLDAACSPAPVPASPPPPPETAPGSVLVAAVGDIADCQEHDGDGATRTASLLKGYPGVPILVAGDIAYQDGTAAQFRDCYDKRWGFLKDRIHPAPGNHEYGIYEKDPVSGATRNDADPYFAYFGASAGPSGRGFYSFDLGAWHVVSLDSMAGVSAGVPKRPVKAPSMEEQIRWLEEDLGKTDKGCILAFWHHPLFSSAEHGHDPTDPGRRVDGLWKTLESHGSDVIVTGHDHTYQRFASQTSAGVVDPAHGIQQFVVGTGGAELTRFVKPPLPNMVQGLDQGDAHGVLMLELHPGSYEWRFVKADGTKFDAGEKARACHPKAPSR